VSTVITVNTSPSTIPANFLIVIFSPFLLFKVYHTAAYEKQLLPVQVPPLFTQFWQLAQAADEPEYPNVSHPGVLQTFGGGVTGGVTGGTTGGVTGGVTGGTTGGVTGGVTGGTTGGVTGGVTGGTTGGTTGGVTGAGAGATGVKELLAEELSES
jgi:hypothetical protein